MEVPIRIWNVCAGQARGIRLDVGEPVEFDLRPGDTNFLGLVRLGPHSPPLPISVDRLRPWAETVSSAATA